MASYIVRILTPEQADAKYATKGELAAVVGGEDGGGGVAVWGSIIGTLLDQPDLAGALSQKQAQLVAGEGIVIDETDPLNPVIAAAVTELTWGSLTGTLADQTDLQAELDGKQPTLVAGDNVVIDNTDPDNPVISVVVDGGGANTAITVNVTTASLAADAREQTSIAVTPLYAVTRIEVDGPARVRMYTSEAQQAADAARARGVDPDPDIDHGVILDFALETAGSRYLSPVVIGSDFTPAGVPVTIDNIDTSAGTITVTFTYWDLSQTGGGVGGGGETATDHVIGVGITKIEAITRTAYNALSPKVATTLYVIDETN